LRVERGTAHMAHPLGFDVVGQFTGDVARPIVAEQSGFVTHMGPVAT